MSWMSELIRQLEQASALPTNMKNTARCCLCLRNGPLVKTLNGRYPDQDFLAFGTSRGIVLLWKLSGLWHELRRWMRITCDKYMKGKVCCPSFSAYFWNLPKKAQAKLWSRTHSRHLEAERPAVKYGKKVKLTEKEPLYFSRRKQKHVLNSASSCTLSLVLPSEVLPSP